jgi:hypothetical protein
MGPLLKDEGDREDGLVGGDLEMVGHVFPLFDLKLKPHPQLFWPCVDVNRFSS